MLTPMGQFYPKVKVTYLETTQYRKLKGRSRIYVLTHRQALNLDMSVGGIRDTVQLVISLM